jgi:hypothetical protein
MDEIIKHGNAIDPEYYKSDMGDIFDIAHAYGLSYPIGTAVKYLCRAGKKNPATKVEDWRKAIRSIERAIELEG